MERYAGADLHKRVTQLALLREGQPPALDCLETRETSGAWSRTNKLQLDAGMLEQR